MMLIVLTMPTTAPMTVIATTTLSAVTNTLASLLIVTQISRQTQIILPLAEIKQMFLTP